MGKFKSTERKGFQITFENGLTVSVQWGAGNYCDNRYNPNFSRTKDAACENAEVAVWCNERWLNANSFLSEEDADWCDDVVGWLTPEQVVDLLYRVRNYPADKISELHKGYMESDFIHKKNDLA